MSRLFNSFQKLFKAAAETGILSPAEDWARSGDWLYVASSNVSEIRYLWDSAILEVLFQDGSAYQYYSIPPSIAMAMHDTDSPGRFVWNVLRAGGYGYAKVGSFGSTGGRQVIRAIGAGG